MISDELFILLSCALSFGLPMAWCVRELFLLRAAGASGRGRDHEPDEPAPAPAPQGEDPDADLPPLPDCLRPILPEAEPVRAAREREMA
ncbi:MAG: hypothetical protein ACFB3T_10085 [Geminicoccaceae bacterium]